MNPKYWKWYTWVVLVLLVVNVINGTSPWHTILLATGFYWTALFALHRLILSVFAGGWGGKK